MQILQDIIGQRLMHFQLRAIYMPKISHHSNDISSQRIT